MAGCETIDWPRVFGPHELTADEAEHIRSCPECRKRLEHIRQLEHVFGAFFELAEQTVCPREKEIPDLVWPAAGVVVPTIEPHMKQCPVCTKAYLELKAFDQSFEAPLESNPLPESIQDAVAAYRMRLSASKTRDVLEKFAARTRKSGQWVEDVVKNIFSGGGQYPAPAARDDLTRSEKETREQDADSAGKDPDEDETK